MIGIIASLHKLYPGAQHICRWILLEWRSKDGLIHGRSSWSYRHKNFRNVPRNKKSLRFTNLLELIPDYQLTEIFLVRVIEPITTLRKTQNSIQKEILLLTLKANLMDHYQKKKKKEEEEKIFVHIEDLQNTHYKTII